MATTTKPVALVSAPTLAAYIPSFQLALLKPTIERAGFEVEPYSLFLYFAQQIGHDLNDSLATVSPSLVGEWLWAEEAFGKFSSEKQYVEEYKHELENVAQRGKSDLKTLVKVRRTAVPKFLDWAVEEIDWGQYSMVGFTVVFQQMLASLALARRIKEKHPNLPIVFGGATFEDDIADQIVRHCPQVDVVHCGDADLTLPDLVRRVTSGASLKGLPGALYRDPDTKLPVSQGRAPNLEQLEKTPVPDFDEFFQTAEAVGYDVRGGEHEVMLPIETARGCWYGMKNHCTFCGLNRAGMDFRSKPAPQVLDMLKGLSRRYGVTWFNAIDNILAPEYAEQLFGVLADGKTDLKLHYEIRPTVSHAQLKSMKAGGLRSVQPGVESFSTHVLTLMKKFTTGMKNLELLKWTTYYGIDNQYNLLYGFAGEVADDYVQMAKLIRLIPHIQPPYAFAIARPDRGSPMFEKPEAHGVTQLRPSKAYEHLFPAAFEPAKVGYFFEDDRSKIPPMETYAECTDLVGEWRDRWHSPARPVLTYLKTWDSLTFTDSRFGQLRLVRYDDRAAKLYESLADARRRDDLLEENGNDAAFVDETLADFESRGLAVNLDGKWLGLALPQHAGH